MAQQDATTTEIRPDYPRKEDGTILLRRELAQKLRFVKEIPAEQVGGVDWTFNAMFGGGEDGVKIVESLVVGQGPGANQAWTTFLLAYTHQKELAERENRPAPSLNAILAAIDVPAGVLLDSIVSSVRQLNARIAQIKISQAADIVREAALMAAMDPEKGFKDREMLLKSAGVIESGGGPGVQVNVNQQVAVKVNNEDLKTPLRQFRTEIKDIDDITRGNVVEGEIIDG